MTDAERRGQRVYEVRLALGPNSRTPLAQSKFAALLTRTGVRKFYGPELSLIEQGKKPLQVDDGLAVAAVDPLTRGVVWLLYGPEAEVTLEERSFLVGGGPCPTSNRFGILSVWQDASKRVVLDANRLRTQRRSIGAQRIVCVPTERKCFSFPTLTL